MVEALGSSGVGVHTPDFQAMAHPAAPAAHTRKMLTEFLIQLLRPSSSSGMAVKESRRPVLSRVRLDAAEDLRRRDPGKPKFSLVLRLSKGCSGSSAWEDSSESFLARRALMML